MISQSFQQISKDFRKRPQYLTKIQWDFKRFRKDYKLSDLEFHKYSKKTTQSFHKESA